VVCKHLIVRVGSLRKRLRLTDTADEIVVPHAQTRATIRSSSPERSPS
jgi:hypothetical protein